MKPIEIETKRLLLRQWQPKDFPAFATLNANPNVMKYFPNILNAQQSNELARKIQADIEQRGWGFWAVEIKKTIPFIGFVGLSIPRANLPFNPCVEIGWRLDELYWGKGYATEAACAVLNVAFNKLNLAEIVAFTAQINEPSRNVMKRIGMHYNGEMFDHPDIESNNILKKHVLYRLAKQRWESALSEIIKG